MGRREKGMKVCFASVLMATAVPFVAVTAEISTAVWQAENVGQSVTNAADWFTPANWAGGTVPNGETWTAEFLASATGTPFIKADQPILLAGMKTRGYADGNADAVSLVSDHGITISVPTEFSHIQGGRIFSDLAAGGSGRAGFGANIELNGRLVASEAVLASQCVSVRLDHFAKSSDPLRDDDVVLDSIYRGSGEMAIVAPRKGAAHSGQWHVTAGSPYVFREATEPKIAAGAVVSCENVFPAGTFVKRIFSDTCIELSQPAAETFETGSADLSFAAITPKTRIGIQHMKMVTWVRRCISFGKHEPDDDFRIEVDRLYATLSTSTNGPALFTAHVETPKGLYPATVVIHDAAGGGTGKLTSDRGFYHQDEYANRLLVELGNCHLEFAETGREGARPGFPDSTGTTVPGLDAANLHSRLTVTNGIAASIGLLTNFTHTIEKDGLGSLWLGLTNHVEKNTGILVVKEGEVVLPAGSWVKSVAVSNGATLRVSGVFAPENFIAEAGAIVEGDGILSLSDSRFAEGVVFSAGVCLQVPGMTELRSETPATNVPASVAFWVDASRPETMTFHGDDGTNVLRIADVRGEDYGFATNTAYTGGYPQLVCNHRGKPHHVYFKYIASNSASQDDCIALVWDKPYTNIRAVFQVLDTRDGGGQFLGKTWRISRQDYMRNAEWGNKFEMPVFNTGTTTERVRSGRFYVNGKRSDPDDGYPYPGGGATRRLEDATSVSWSAPAVFSVHPSEDTEADAFGFNNIANNRNGRYRVCECLIFTNEVTETERLAITGYLMKKWLDHEVSWTMTDGDPFPAVDAGQVAGIAVAEGEQVSVGGVTGSETFVKKGEGTLFFEDYAVADGSLDVAAGNLTVNSRLPSASDIPEGAYVHFDASDLSTLTVSASSGMVSAWKDVRGDGYLTAKAHANTTSKWATVTYDTPLLGMSAVDFGEYRGFAKGGSMVDRRMSSSLWYPACGELHTVFMVMDTSQGGGVLVGNGQDMRSGWGGSFKLSGPDDGYGLRRFEVPGELTYSMPILTNANWSGQKNLLYEGGSRVRLNGEKINPLTTGFSGGWDIVSLVSYEDFGGGSFASSVYNRYVGGQTVGEAILYREGLSERQVEAVEAYLRRKWFGTDSPRYRPAAVSNLTVRSGATLSVTGGQPLTVNGAFSGGGSVEGALAFGSGAVLTVTVGPGGTVVPVQVSGAVDFSAGGTVLVTGALSELQPGEYRILSSSSAMTGVAGLKVVFDGDLRRNLGCSVRADAAGLVLSIKAPGMTVIVR